jgi:uncharacterized protein DUF4440
MRRTIAVVACGLSLALGLLSAPARTQQQAPDAAVIEQEVVALFDRFVTAQNAHNLTAVGELLWDNPGFLWITGGTPIRGEEAALKRFTTLYQGTWRLEPKQDELQVTLLTADVAEIYAPIDFTIGPAGQAATTTRFLWNAVLVKTGQGWQVASILPIAVPKP